MNLEKNTKTRITRLRIGRQVKFMDAGYRTVRVMKSVTQRNITIYIFNDIKTGNAELCSHNALTERIEKGTASFVN